MGCPMTAPLICARAIGPLRFGACVLKHFQERFREQPLAQSMYCPHPIGCAATARHERRHDDDGRGDGMGALPLALRSAHWGKEASSLGLGFPYWIGIKCYWIIGALVEAIIW